MKNVIFDTNAYRTYFFRTSACRVKPKAKKLRKREIASNIEASICPIVLMELFFHLHDKADPGYKSCKKGVIALVEHCQTRTVGVNHIPDPETAIAKLLMLGPIPGHQETTDRLITTALNLWENTSEKDVEKIRWAITVAKEAIEEFETRFIADMDTLVKKIDPSTTSWKPLASDKTLRKKVLAFIRSSDFLDYTALSQVERVANRLDLSLTTTEKTAHKDTVLTYCLVGLKLWQRLLDKLIGSGMNMEKHVNYYLDFQIALMVNSAATSDEDGFFLVTGDKAIRQAAVDAGVPDRIRGLDDYEKSLI